MRDSQKNQVYIWEHSRFKTVSKIPLTLEQCQTLVNDVCRCYGIHSPTVKFKEGYQGKVPAHYTSFSCEIVLPEFARFRHFLWHELAHHVNHVKNLGKEKEGHGPEYFSIYAYLLNQYGCYPLHEIFFKAQRLGINHDKNFPQFLPGMVPNPELVRPYS